MRDSSSSLYVGEIVEILMGRDKGSYAIVIKLDSEDERYVFIADGDKRKYDRLKRKNVRHLKASGFISQGILDSLKENGRVSNAKLRYVLNDYISNHLNEEEKGE